MALGTMVGMTAPFVESINGTIAILAFTCLSFMMWSVNVMILPSDFFAPQNVGTVLGLSGTVNGVGNMIKNLVIGRVLDRTGSFNPHFSLGGAIERVDADQPDSAASA